MASASSDLFSLDHSENNGLFSGLFIFLDRQMSNPSGAVKWALRATVYAGMRNIAVTLIRQMYCATAGTFLYVLLHGNSTDIMKQGALMTARTM